MPDEKVRALTEDYEAFSLPKHELIITENKPIRNSYFLESGYIRSYTCDSDGEEVTTNIYSAPCFVNDFYSFFKRLPARQNYQTITACYGWTLSFEKVERKFNNSPEFREFGRLMVLDQYDQLNERMLGMIKDTAESRYTKLLAKHPDIFQNVPLKIIASFLGITDSSLSRIRKEILHK
jgi:CRP-like cAMP-binding protein